MSKCEGRKSVRGSRECDYVRRGRICEGEGRKGKRGYT